MKLGKKVKKVIVMLLCISMISINLTPAFAIENESLPILGEDVEEVVNENSEEGFNETKDLLEEQIQEEQVQEEKVASSSDATDEDIEEFEEDIDLSLVEEPEEDSVEVVEELEKSTDEIAGEFEIEASPSEVNEELEDIDSLDVSENSNIASISEIETNESLDTALFGGSRGDSVYWYYRTVYNSFSKLTFGYIILTTQNVPTLTDGGQTYTLGGLYTDTSSATFSASLVNEIKILDDIYPTSLKKYFYNANAKIVGLEKIHTDDATDMSYMFANYRIGNGLDNTDISLLNTTGITDMSHMFEGCTVVQSINVSSFDTSSVTTMDSMFSGCSSLKTIIGKDGFVPSGATGNDMFLNCGSLLGCKGTTYSATKTDESMAVIDKYDGVTPGYFSKKIVATLNGYKYSSLYNAINDVKDSETIQVIDDIDEIIETESITIDNGKTFTINFKESSGTQHSFTYGPKNSTYYPKPVFHISNGSKVTINDMVYQNVGPVTSNIDTIFKVEDSSTSLNLKNFTNVMPLKGKGDILLEIDKSDVSIDNSNFTTKENSNVIKITNSGNCSVDTSKFTVDDYNIYNGGGIIYVDATCTDKSNTKISIKDSSCFGTYMVGLRGNATVDVSGTSTFKGGYGPILVVGGKDSDITLNDFTSDSTDNTSGTVVGIVIGTDTMSRLVNKAKIYGNAYKYKAGKLSSDTGSTPATTSDVIIYSGKFGPDTGKSPANKKEIEDLLAPMKMVVEITDATDLANGYYYKVENIPIQCKIGSTEYTTIQDAVNAVQDLETIKIVKDLTYDTPVIIDNGKKFTIDFKEDSTTQHTFKWYDAKGSQTDKDIFTIKNGSNVHIQNLNYSVGAREHNNRVFKVENTGTLTIDEMICSSSDNVKDTIVRNDGGIVTINGGNITLANRVSGDFYAIVENLGGTTTIKGNGTYTSCEGAVSSVWLGEVTDAIDPGDSPDIERGNIIIENGIFNEGPVVCANGKGNITINDATCNSKDMMFFIYFAGVKSNITIKNITATTANYFVVTTDNLQSKIDFQNGNVIYPAGAFCFNAMSGTSSNDIAIKNGKFGPSDKTTDIHDEIDNLKVKGAIITAISEAGYTYKVTYVPPTPTPKPTPAPYNPGGGSGGSSSGGPSGGTPKYGSNGDIIGPSGNIEGDEQKDLSNLTDNSYISYWDYNTSSPQVADIHYVQSIDTFVRRDNSPVITEWVGVVTTSNSKINWYRTDATGKILKNQFVNIDNHVYYFDNNGVMVTGQRTINGIVCYFDTTIGRTEGRLII